MRNTVLVAQRSDKAGPAEGADVIYTVEEGDTLSGIALAFYGDADQAERIYEANVGRQEPGGRQFNRHGLIIPGWTLQIPSASRGVVQEDSGARWYVVKHGDTYYLMYSGNGATDTWYAVGYATSKSPLGPFEK